MMRRNFYEYYYFGSRQNVNNIVAIGKPTCYTIWSAEQFVGGILDILSLFRNITKSNKIQLLSDCYLSGVFVCTTPYTHSQEVLKQQHKL
jgi:hypothetical protein